MKLAIAAIRGHAVAIVHLEKAAAVDGGIERVVGDADTALGKLLNDGRHLGTQTDRRRTRTAQRGRENVRKLG